MRETRDENPERNKAVEVKNLMKTYGARGFQTRVLKGIDLTIYRQDFIAIMGPSGSGKTTLLNILSTIDKPTEGTVILDGQDITRVSNKELSRLRREKIGFIFGYHDASGQYCLAVGFKRGFRQGMCGEGAGIGRLVWVGGSFKKVSISAVRRAEAEGSGVSGADYRPGDTFCG